MNLELRFFATFRDAVGQKIVHREFSDDATAGDVLSALEADYDDLEGAFFDEQGDLRPMLSILKNGKDIVHIDGVETTLEDGDAISVFPPVAGG